MFLMQDHGSGIAACSTGGNAVVGVVRLDAVSVLLSRCLRRDIQSDGDFQPGDSTAPSVDDSLVEHLLGEVPHACSCSDLSRGFGPPASSRVRFDAILESAESFFVAELRFSWHCDHLFPL